MPKKTASPSASQTGSDLVAGESCQPVKHRFGGVQRLYGDEGFARVRAAHVCVVGIGGVGSWAAEALARSGVGRITLIDADDICETNINRQCHALSSTIGLPKVEAMARRIAEINPAAQVRAEARFLLAGNVAELLADKPDFVIDAIDTVKNKCVLIAHCRDHDIPVITVGAAGGKTDPGHVTIADLGRAHGDRLLAKLRVNLRRHWGFPRYEGRKFHVACVYSPQPARLPQAGEPGYGLRLDCASGFGTVCHMTSVFGMQAAGHVLNALASQT